MKFGPNGNRQWKQGSTLPYPPTASGMRVDQTGTAYITGLLGAPVTFGSVTLINATGRSMFLAKYDASRHPIWAVQSGTNSNLGQGAMDLDGDGNCYLAGGFKLLSAGPSDSFVLRVGTASLPPSITTGPASLSVRAGENASFAVSASGSQPLLFQWQFSGTNLPGATNRELVIPEAGPGQAGRYRCRVTNRYGAALSSDAFLEIKAAPPASTFSWLQQTLTASGDRKISFNAVAAAPAGETYVAGSVVSQETPIFLDPTTQIRSGGVSDAFVAKYSAAGSLLWFRQWGGNTSLRYSARGISLDADGNCYIIGHWDNNDGASHGVVLASFTPGGGQRWLIATSNTKSSQIGISTDSAGNSFVLTSEPQSGGAASIYAVNRYSPAGQAMGQFITPPASALELDRDGDLLPGGSFTGTLSLGGSNLASRGGQTCTWPITGLPET